MTTTSTFTFDHAKLSKGQLTMLRVALIVGGIVAIGVGIAIFAWPAATLALVAWLFGIFFIVSGIVRAVTGIVGTKESGGMRILSVIFGVLLVLSGIYVLMNPVFGVMALAFVVGFAWIVEGIAVLSLTPSGGARWMAILYGILSIVAGIFVLMSPAQAVTIFLIFAAVILVVEGIAQIFQGFMIGRGAKNAA